MTLRPGGNLLMKIIQGPAEKELSELAGFHFKQMQRVKPSASRNESAETYYLCQGYQQSQNEDALKIKKIREELETGSNDSPILKEF